MTKSDIYQQLREVIDPETNLNIVDMGLIYDVQVVKQSEKNVEKSEKPDQHYQVIITYTLTTPGCPLAGSFPYLITQQLQVLASEQFNPQEDISLQLTFDPPWHLGLMSEEAQAELGF